MQLVTSDSIASMPSNPRPAPLPPASRSPVTKLSPFFRWPPNAMTKRCPLLGAGTWSGAAAASADNIVPQILLVVAVYRADGKAGSSQAAGGHAVHRAGHLRARPG